MVIIGRKKPEKFVRIKLGNSETGNSSFYAPVKTIIVPKANIHEVYDVIMKALNKKYGK